MNRKRTRACAICCRIIDTTKLSYVWSEWFCDRSKDKQNGDECDKIDAQRFLMTEAGLKILKEEDE